MTARARTQVAPPARQTGGAAPSSTKVMSTGLIPTRAVKLSPVGLRAVCSMP